MRRFLVGSIVTVVLGYSAFPLQGSTQAEIAPVVPDIVERSGCCSWHGGVCGCDSGRAVCCDGMLSPSCGC